MSPWQLYPNHIWVADRDHTVVLLVMGLPERQVLGATIVQEPADAAAMMTPLVDAHGCPGTLRSIWDPLFEDLNSAARNAVHDVGCAHPVGQLDPDDFVWVLDIGTPPPKRSGPATPPPSTTLPAPSSRGSTRPHGRQGPESPASARVA